MDDSRKYLFTLPRVGVCCSLRYLSVHFMTTKDSIQKILDDAKHEVNVNAYPTSFLVVIKPGEEAVTKILSDLGFERIFTFPRCPNPYGKTNNTLWAISVIPINEEKGK